MKTTVSIGGGKRRVGVDFQDAQDLVEAMLEHGLDSDECMLLLFLAASGIHRVTSLAPTFETRSQDILGVLKQVYENSEKIQFKIDFHIDVKKE